jgi:erythromycin esterase
LVAGRNWGDDMRKIKVSEAMQGSWEHSFNSIGKNRLRLMHSILEEQYLSDYIYHRTVGIVYNPAQERYGNYVPTIIPKKHDASIYLDRTTALLPLHIQPDSSQIQETDPFGM